MTDVPPTLNLEL